MDWEAIGLIGSKQNQKTGRPYRQQYLKASLYLELHLRWTEPELLAALYRRALERLSPLLRYHQTDRMTRVRRIRDREIALRYFPELLESTRSYAWAQLTDVAGVGTEREIGGVGSAKFEAWIHRASYSPELAARQVDQYREALASYQTDMLHTGLRISRVQVCFPIDTFPSLAGFKQWVVDNELVAQGHFFSGSAGYKLHYYEGYVDPVARERLAELLHTYPGFDFDAGIGNSLGRVLNARGTDFVPVVKRVNWLTFVSDAGLALLGGTAALSHALADDPQVQLDLLGHGACLQAGTEPALATDDPSYRSYVRVSRALAPLLHRPHERDHYSSPSDSAAKAWLYHFQRQG